MIPKVRDPIVPTMKNMSLIEMGAGTSPESVASCSVWPRVVGSSNGVDVGDGSGHRRAESLGIGVAVEQDDGTHRRPEIRVLLEAPQKLLGVGQTAAHVSIMAGVWLEGAAGRRPLVERAGYRVPGSAR